MIFKWFWREWKTPSLIIVWLAMSLSVAAILALGNLGDRLEQRLNSYSREFMAGDRVLRSTRPADPTWLAKATELNLSTSQQLSFQTMAFASEEPVDTEEISSPLLISIKATDAAYPLYGQLVTEPANLKIKSGEVIVAKEVLLRLKLNLGDYIDIGDGQFKIAGLIIKEPDAGFTGIQSAPKVLMHLEDIEKTGAVQLGSRLTYRYMFAGDGPNIDGFSQYIEPILPVGYRFLSDVDQASGLSKTVDRARQFLILCSILTLLLGASAVAVAMTHYTRTRYKLVAVLKTIGATHGILRKWIIGQWIALLSVSIITGGILGIFTEQGLIFALGDILPSDLPTPGIKPWIWASLSLVVMALLVGLRPYVQLLLTQPIRVLRQSSLTNHWPLKIYLPIVTVIILGMLLALVGFNKIVWSVLFGMILLGLMLGVSGWGLLKILKHIKTTNLPFRLAINRLLHQPSITISQLCAFSLSFMLLSLLIAMQGDLLGRWQAQLPKETPSYILMNINEAQKSEIDTYFEAQPITADTDYFTIVLARITQLNRVPIKEAVDETAAKTESLNREINLTQLNELPSSNQLIEGTWPPKAGETSIEQGVASQIGIQLGDEITFDSGGREFTAKVSSIRKVDWESMQLNFYFIFPLGDLDAYTKMWVTPLVIDSNKTKATDSKTTDSKTTDTKSTVETKRLQMMAEFSKQFPTVSVLDITALLKQAQQIISQVSGALQFMAGLVILCGVLLMFAQVQVSMRQRHIELVVYRTLGASSKMLNHTLWIEFLILGAVSGVVAVIGAEVALWSLQKFVFEFAWAPNFKLWTLTPIAASTLLVACGWLLSRRLLNYRANLRALSV